MVIAAAMEACNANGEWLTLIAADDDDNGCYHGDLQLQQTTSMMTSETCDGGVVFRAVPTREPSMVTIRAHDARCARAAE